jgi:PhnB protein
MKFNPYIKVNDGKCREAMNFYQSCFGGELSFMTLGESPMAKETAPEIHNRIMHATLTKDGVMLFSASDMMRDMAIIGDNVGISINFESEEEIRNVFEKLKEGGDVFMPLEDVFWGALFGVLTDKYGVEWMLNFQRNK